jgi:outer membrane protein assembly factor BamB
MKTSRYTFLLFTLIVFAALLSGCAGGTGVASSWPGVTVDGDTAYVAFNTHVFAINLADGMERWRFPAEPDNKVTFYAAPTLTPDGQLVVGSYNNAVYSLNPTNNGSQNWVFDKASDRFIASPLATENGIYAPSAGRLMYALDLNGNQRWTFETEHGQWASPLPNNGYVILPSMDHRIYALDPETGNVVWQTEDLGGAIVSAPALADDGTLYIGTFNREVLAINSETGQVLNRFATEGWVWGSPALDGDRLYVGDLNGFVYALNAADLTQIWKVQPETGANTSISDRPLVLEDKLYIASESGNVYALNTSNGSTNWTQTVGGKLYGSPVLAGDKILVAPIGEDYILAALDLNGVQQWTFTPQKN